ncbi:hypothetical protein N7G274_006350 [Stereocaulon virgatum]|uniref:Uncharacterized protein n=1 Tax=Stereocaulon virgatum TaxID=373712 RepID=A0ABR4A908_9LECA
MLTSILWTAHLWFNDSALWQGSSSRVRSKAKVVVLSTSSETSAWEELLIEYKEREEVRGAPIDRGLFCTACAGTSFVVPLASHTVLVKFLKILTPRITQMPLVFPRAIYSGFVSF